ncbi:DUF504 domain-containing protein [Pontiella sp.]|uniref:DUF504 domain-containing protein n=1 Tax=Pontiella sp. TaxID=2837462 RepID=UPI003567058C
METIQQVLSHIRWDPDFGQGDFEVGIYDRVADAVEFHALGELRMESGNRFSFGIVIDGVVRDIPYHRIREVRKNGATIWRR